MPSPNVSLRFMIFLLSMNPERQRVAAPHGPMPQDDAPFMHQCEMQYTAGTICKRCPDTVQPRVCIRTLLPRPVQSPDVARVPGRPAPTLDAR